MNKYSRLIGKDKAVVDVYDVLKAFNVVCPAIQHAVKKLLAPGQRGMKTVNQDLLEAQQSITRAIELNDYPKDGKE